MYNVGPVGRRLICFEEIIVVRTRRHQPQKMSIVETVPSEVSIWCPWKYIGTFLFTGKLHKYAPTPQEYYY